MMHRTGRIIAIEDQTMRVAVQAEAHCAGCASRSSCHGGAEAPVIDVPLGTGMQLGEEVALEMEEGTLTRSALLVYLLPPVCLLIGAGMANTASHSDAIAMIGAVLGLICGFGAARLLAGLFSEESLSPVVSPCSHPQTPTLRSPAP